MLLKSMKLKDFRQFKGSQSIAFSIDPDKNVTVIMGENGSGKTTLAQAFTWCLYGETTFEDKSLLCKATGQNLPVNSVEIVYVEICLEHRGIEYTITREQRYTKDSSGNIKRPSSSNFKVAYKRPDGQYEFVKDLETDFRMKEILPKELSQYFFFDGERIGNMSKEIRKGKSKEFAQAVQGLLGLSALTSAMEHLKARGSKNSVIRSYEQSFDGKSNVKIAEHQGTMDKCDMEIEKIDQRLEEIAVEEEIALKKCEELNEKIRQNEESEKLASQKSNLQKRIQDIRGARKTNVEALLKTFNKNAQGYISRKLIKDVLNLLSESDKLDKGIPDIHARTIEYIIKRDRCICGTHIHAGTPQYRELNNLLDYIPPQSIGTLIAEFVRDCEIIAKSSEDFFDIFSSFYTQIRNFDTQLEESSDDIMKIETKLQGLTKVGDLQKELMKYEGALRRLSEQKETLWGNRGGYTTTRSNREAQLNELSLKDSNNRKIQVYKAYAQYLYNVIAEIYKQKETETRQELEGNVNQIFRNIYKGGLSLSIDEKYNIQIAVSDLNGSNDDIETSTAQSISIIFAFISGVIKMARKNKNASKELLVTEPYPLVMDAPLSSFDKTRIKTVCTEIPLIAEQIIFFIKDTDGELAEQHMGTKVGAKFAFDKKNEIETYLTKR